MCEKKVLTPWPGDAGEIRETCNGFAHTYRDRNDKPRIPLQNGVAQNGTWRAVCPRAEWWEARGYETPPWAQREDREARERRALVDSHFIHNPQTFENYDAAFNGHAEALRSVQRFLDDERIRRLILKGDVGRGKSHLAQACINASRPALGYRAEMISAYKLYWMLREVESFEPDAITLKAYGRFQRARMLAVDDLGTEKQTDTQVFNQALKDLLETFNGRLIVTTNLDERQMVELYGQKIVSRLHEDALLVVLKGKDYRLNK